MLSTERSSSPTKIIQEDTIAPTVVATQNVDMFSVSGPPQIEKTAEEKSLEMMKKLAEDVFDPTEDPDKTVSWNIAPTIFIYTSFILLKCYPKQLQIRFMI